ncbi:hypothetical protein LX32DRAFT_294634 [Colletotrichum zoysiae]|uniref:Uncharacterized protein n=1 Tax=Colletotrichum zoysiae TaxID=1216348 RepID=A0AAD9H3P3_9PEZI|nr:hypothetical protein LX32DRAFT_294634 [Colletotrichum zoysiae]
MLVPRRHRRRKRLVRRVVRLRLHHTLWHFCIHGLPTVVASTESPELPTLARIPYPDRPRQPTAPPLRYQPQARSSHIGNIYSTSHVR